MGAALPLSSVLTRPDSRSLDGPCMSPHLCTAHPNTTGGDPESTPESLAQLIYTWHSPGQLLPLQQGPISGAGGNVPEAPEVLLL